MIKFRGKAIYAEEWVEGSLIDFPEYKGREIIPAESTSYLDAIDIYPDTLQVMTTDGWADIADVEVVRKKKSCSHSCSPGDYKEGGKCDKMGCYKSETT